MSCVKTTQVTLPSPHHPALQKCTWTHKHINQLVQIMTLLPAERPARGGGTTRGPPLAGLSGFHTKLMKLVSF